MYYVLSRHSEVVDKEHIHQIKADYVAKYDIIKDLKHKEKQVKIKENYDLKYDIYSSIYKKYI